MVVREDKLNKNVENCILRKDLSKRSVPETMKKKFAYTKCAKTRGHNKWCEFCAMFTPFLHAPLWTSKPDKFPSGGGGGNLGRLSLKFSNLSLATFTFGLGNSAPKGRIFFFWGTL